MNVVDVSRWQFGITTVYHFIFVPLTIGLAPLIAVMQTVWVVTDNVAWYRLTKFFGKLFLINFAIGVATGIVQEFQFGMNWSEYSRFVGDVFGAPLAMEGLAAFFFESTFIGLWIFGWSRLPTPGPPGLHLDRRHRRQRVGVLHHRGELLHAAPGRRALQPDDPTGRAGQHRRAADAITLRRAAFSHTVAGSLLTGGTFVAAVSAWWMVRSHPDDPRDESMPAPCIARRPSWDVWVALAAAVGFFFTGDAQGKLMFASAADEDGFG